MKSRRRNRSNGLASTILLGVLVGAGGPQAADLAPSGQPWEPDRSTETVELAIVLDTGESMKPFLEAASAKSWEIVEQLSLRKDPPTLRVGLVSYGGNDRAQVRLETDFTMDLGFVSERLFALDSGTGHDRVGPALQTALEGLSWTDSDDVLKLIVIAGAEPAEQDRSPLLSFRDASEVARQEVILVDDIDAELAELSAAINETFVPLGEQGAKRRQNALAQDRNAEQVSTSLAASRALVKASPRYSAGWDLLEALATEQLDLHAMENSELLPKELREMSLVELERHVGALARRRHELRERITELGDRRRLYVVEKLQAKGLDDTAEFVTTGVGAFRKRLARNGYVVVELKPPDFEPSIVSAPEQ